MTSASTLDLAPILSWIVAAVTIINFIVLMKSLLSSGEKKLEEKVAKAEGKLIEHDRRVQAIESDLKHLPDRNTTHRLELVMEQIIGRLNTMEKAQDGRFSTMEERLKPIQSVGERLEEALLEQAKQAGREKAA